MMLIEAQGLSKTYRDILRRRATRALVDASLRIEQGVIFGLIGPNGAGKTTLIKMLLGLTRPTSGTARVLGRPPGAADALRRIGYLPEQMLLPEYMKAVSFLRYMGRLNGVEASALEERIPRLLELVGLLGEKKIIREYSKGMQQRLGLAQALLNDADLLLLDEPTEGLDPKGRKEVRDHLLALRSAGKTIFLNSHILSEVELICDRLLMVHRGRLVREGKPADFTPATGEYRVRLARVTDAARAAVEDVLGPVEWDGVGARIRPRDTAQLNALIDRLRAVPVEIEAVEPVHLTLEEYFLEVVTGSEA